MTRSRPAQDVAFCVCIRAITLESLLPPHCANRYTHLQTLPRDSSPRPPAAHQPHNAHCIVPTRQTVKATFETLCSCCNYIHTSPTYIYIYTHTHIYILYDITSNDSHADLCSSSPRTKSTTIIIIVIIIAVVVVIIIATL